MGFKGMTFLLDRSWTPKNMISNLKESIWDQLVIVLTYLPGNIGFDHTTDDGHNRLPPISEVWNFSGGFYGLMNSHMHSCKLTKSWKIHHVFMVFTRKDGGDLFVYLNICMYLPSKKNTSSTANSPAIQTPQNHRESLVVLSGWYPSCSTPHKSLLQGIYRYTQ